MRNPAFADLLNQLMSSAGVSGRILAQDIDVDTAQVSRWRHGSVPRPPQIARLAEYFGVDQAKLMVVAYPGTESLSPQEQAQARVSAWRQSVHEQLERWIAAVGPEYEEYFWRYLKTQGDSGVAFIHDLGTAVNEAHDGAVNPAVSGPLGTTNGRNEGPDGGLRARYRGANDPLDSTLSNANELLAA